MPRFLYTIAVLLAIAWGVYDLYPRIPVKTAPGVLAPDEPIQQTITSRALPATAGYELTAVADYALTGRVLSTRHYNSDRGSKLVPVDVAAGWGSMSDQAVLDHVRISQAFRFFFMEWRGAPPVSKKDIISHAANMHIIPANEAVESTVSRLRRGQVVSLSGQLVNARGPHGEIWNTSLSRDDVGGGACELFYVEAIAVTEHPQPAGVALANSLPAAR